MKVIRPDEAERNEIFMKKVFHEHPEILIGLLLIGATLAVYWPVSQHAFINFDDNRYVTQNPQVRSGLSLAGVRWAMTTRAVFNWHPVTWLSHMLDVQLFGMAPGAHHLTNLFFHLLNSLLLFLVLNRMSGKTGSSGFVAVLFALHPLHVESVAWIAERKDVLSTFFMMLTLLSYHFYAKRPTISRYLPILFFFVLGLMAKPMLVTLPFGLFLLDFWPLERIRVKQAGGHLGISGGSDIRFLIVEKLPLFLLAAVSSAITLAVQESEGAVDSLDVIPLSLRIGNAVLSYFDYLVKTIWPSHLAVFYPYVGRIPVWRVIMALLVLGSITFLAINQGRRRPWLSVGWFWYLGTLVPVIGLVQVGAQSMADRYTYIPLIGIFIIIVWGFYDFSARWRYKTLGRALPAGIIVLLLMILARIQLNFWDNSVSLFEHALRVTRENALAHNMLADALAAEGRYSEAAAHLYAGLAIQPKNAGAYNNLANIMSRQGRSAAAIGYLRKALQLDPKLGYAHYNLANLLMAIGKEKEAIDHYQRAVKLQPDNAGFHNNLANALIKAGQPAPAIDHYRTALRLNPGDFDIHNNLGVALFLAGKMDLAVKHFKTALKINPKDVEASKNLQKALEIQKKINRENHQASFQPRVSRHF